MDIMKLLDRTLGKKRTFNTTKELTQQIKEYTQQAEHPNFIELRLYLGITRQRHYEFKVGRKNWSKAHTKKCREWYDTLEHIAELYDTLDVATLKKGQGNLSGVMFFQKAFRKRYDRPDNKKDAMEQTPAAQVIIKTGGGNNDLS